MKRVKIKNGFRPFKTDVFMLWISHIGNLGIEFNTQGISKIVLGVKNNKNKNGEIQSKTKFMNQHKVFINNLKEYFEGKKIRFSIKYYFSGLSNFTKKVLNETKKIPYGTTITYQELAARIGNPQASRAVGQALGRNPLPIIVPCHRVIRKDNSLGGFSAGMEWKKILLDLEKNTETAQLTK